MKKLGVVLLVAFVAATGCKGKGGDKNERAGAEVQKRTKLSINYDMAEEKRLQEAVDHGSQAWRKEAVDVAHAALINQGINAKVEECKLTEDHNAHSVVNARCRDGEFNIMLKRLVKPDGIWTATDIELVGDYKGLGAPSADNAGQDQGSVQHDHGAMHDHAGH